MRRILRERRVPRWWKEWEVALIKPDPDNFCVWQLKRIYEGFKEYSDYDPEYYYNCYDLGCIKIFKDKPPECGESETTAKYEITDMYTHKVVGILHLYYPCEYGGIKEALYYADMEITKQLRED